MKRLFPVGKELGPQEMMASEACLKRPGGFQEMWEEEGILGGVESWALITVGKS